MGYIAAGLQHLSNVVGACRVLEVCYISGDLLLDFVGLGLVEFKKCAILKDPFVQ